MTKWHSNIPVRILFAVDGLQVEQGEEGPPAGAADLLLRGGNGDGGLVALAAEQSLSKRVRLLLRRCGKK